MKCCFSFFVTLAAVVLSAQVLRQQEEPEAARGQRVLSSYISCSARFPKLSSLDFDFQSICSPAPTEAIHAGA